MTAVKYGSLGRSLLYLFGLIVASLLLEAQASAASTESAKAESLVSVAVLPFAASTEELADIAQEIPNILTAHLSANPAMMLVERGDLDKALSEMELGLAGAVDPASAVKIGSLTGAQVLITGRVFPVQRDIVIVSRIIGVETGRVFGETVSFPARGSILEASTQLAEQIGQSMATRQAMLVPEREPKESLIDRLRTELAGQTLPSVSVSIPEVSLNRETIDPAAETEIAFILQSVGFEIIDPLASNSQPDVEITGEAFSEYGIRVGNLVSSKGRVELKAIDRKVGKVLLVDREVSVAMDIAPEVAGKTALAQAAEKLVERLVPAMMGAGGQP